MPIYEFSLVLACTPDLNEALADRLFAAGCDDGSPVSRAGITRVDFDREAEDLEAAIRSAIANVQQAGCVVQRVEIDPGSVLVKN